MAMMLRSRRADLWEQIMRVLDIQGPLPDAIDPQLDMSAQVLDLTDPVYLWPRRVRRFFSAINLGAAAGFNGRVEYVLTAPQTICELTLTIFNTNAAQLAVGIEQLFAGTVMASTAREQNADLRQPVNFATGVPLPLMDVRSSAGIVAGPGANAIVVNVGPGQSFTLPTIIVDAELPATGLGGGGVGVIAIATVNVNVGLCVFGEWTERLKSPQE